MLNQKIENRPISSLSTQGFFARETGISQLPGWQVLHSGYWHSILFHASNKTVLGLGRNPFKDDPCNKRIWTVPLRDEFQIKQIAAGDRHILILYQNGILEGYGFGGSGQLGIGYFSNRNPVSVCISLPDKVTPVQIAAAEDYSFVIGDNNCLYGFGSNRDGQLGLGKTDSAAFPTLIPLPDKAIPVKIFTGYNRTIIACKDGSLYGFGSQSSNQLGRDTYYDDPTEKIPSRLTFFESLNPANFGMGKNGVIVHTTHGECYFYGYDLSDLLPISYGQGKRKIILPEGIKPQSVSFNHSHLVLQSEQGELWSTQFRTNKSKEKFVKINFPSSDKTSCIVAGWDTTWFLGANDFCVVSGNNEYCKLGLEDSKAEVSCHRLSMSNLLYKKEYEKIDTKLISSCIKPLDNLFAETITSPFYQDDTEFIEALESDNSHIIEILRPQGFGKSLALSTACAWFSNLSASQKLFQNYHIWLGSRHIKTSFGQYPVILLDLANIDISSYYNFIKSYREIMAELYIKHRHALFSGILKDKKDERHFYQLVATQSPVTWMDNFKVEDILKKLIEHLHNQYNKRVMVLIDNADYLLRTKPTAYDPVQIEKELTCYINNAIEGDSTISRTVLMGQYASAFATRLKQTHDLATIDSPYLSCFGFTMETLLFNKLTVKKPIFELQHKIGGYYAANCIEFLNARHTMQWISGHTDFKLYEENYVIDQLKASPKDCEHIGALLQDKVILFKQDWLETTGLLTRLIHTGFLNIKHTVTDDRFITIPNDTAKQALQKLHTRWQIQNLKRVTVVLDIDEVLATHDHCSPETALFFLRKGTIIRAYGITHYIPPGRLELLRYLYSMPEVHVVFFSSGIQARNYPFVEALLIAALGKDHYRKIAADVTILSDCDCSSNIGYKDQFQFSQYGLESTDTKKNISLAIAPEDSQDNAILIDNNPGVVYYEQEKNYLFAETLESRDFETLKKLADEGENPDDALFKKLNDIFRWTAILANCIKNRTTQPVQDKLFAMQFAPKTSATNNSPSFEPLWLKPGNYNALYNEGLAILQEFNPDLNFTTTQYYQDCVTPLPSNDQNQFIEEAIKHEYTETCLVM